MYATKRHLEIKQMKAADLALDVTEMCGRLKAAARQSTRYAEREAFRAMAKKIRHRRELNLTVSWWMKKAEELLKGKVELP